MSRFWGGDDTESEEEEEESPDEANMHLTSRFAATFSDDEEDEVKRVVKSHKDKHLDSLNEIADSIEDTIDEGDGKVNFIALSEAFTKLNDALPKWKKAAKASELAPPPYYRALLLLQQEIEKVDNKKKKSLEKNNARALTALGQKFKKNLAKYKDEFEAYKENPEDGMGGQEPEELDQDDDDDIFAKPAEEPEEEEEEEEEEDKGKGINKWLAGDDEEDEGSGKKKRSRKRNRNKGAAKKADASQNQNNKGKKDAEWTVERVNNELKTIISGKSGKKKLDKSAQLLQLRELLDKAKNVSQELAIRMHIITTHFDQTVSMKQHLTRENWMVAYNEIVKILCLLDANRAVKLKESGADDKKGGNNETEEFQSARLVAFLERLRDEMFKAYRAMDIHALDYSERLGDEELIQELAWQMARYYNRTNQTLEVAQISLVRMVFLHYRSDSLPEGTVLPLRSSNLSPAQFPDQKGKPQGTRSELLDKMLAIVCQFGNERMKAHALLYTIYHHAIEKRFFEARDLLLMSHLQDQIQHADVATQILHNRAMAQLGICAFRSGRIYDAHNCLSELFQTNRVRELVAQGVTQRYGDRNTEQEKIEKQRQMPYHMHMNYDLLESTHLISAMLLETPNMATHGYDVKKRVISRPFRRLMDIYDRQVFGGPPESPKDYIIATARSLRAAKADEAFQYALNLKCWDHYPEPESVKEILEKNIREVALQTFLLKHSSSFASVSVDFLAKTTGLPPKSVHTIVSKMMINEEVQSCWHQPSGTVVMHQTEPNKFQSLVLQYADKVETFVTENERTFENRTGGFGYDKRGNRDDDADRKGQGWRDGGRRDGGKKFRDGGKGKNYGGYGGRDGGYRNWDNDKKRNY